MLHIEKFGPRDALQGRAELSDGNTLGFFTRDGVNGQKQLAFDIYSSEFSSGHVNPYDIRTFPILRPSLFFHINLEEQHCLIGRSVWTETCRLYNGRLFQHSPMGPDFLPDYDALQNRLRTNGFTYNHREFGLLYCLRIAIGNSYLVWSGNHPLVPILMAYVGNRIPSDICSIGSEILKKAFIIVDSESTCFFPKPVPLV